MIEIGGEKKKVYNWDEIKTAYINGASGRSIAKRYGISPSAVQKRAKRENWNALREHAERAAEARVINATADAAAGNAEIANEIKHALLLRLKRIVDKYPFDATEVRTHEGKNTVIFRIRDLTAAYKDLTDDMPTSGGRENELLMSLVELERRLQ